jgi:hypothetical protein
MKVISLGDYYKIDPASFERSGALDPVLGVDTRLFIDPRLLSANTIPELSGSYKRLTQRFIDVLKLVSKIEKEDDVFWRKADKLLTFPEVKGLCIGYSAKGVSGRGAGPLKRKRLLETTVQLVKAGCSDPKIFELVGLFEEGVGPDLISDMVAKIIIADLVSFSQRVCSDLAIPMEPFEVLRGEPTEDLPFDPIQETPIILIPKEILRDLPIATQYGDIAWVAQHNENLRKKLNEIIGSALEVFSTSAKKEKLKEAFLQHPTVLNEVVAAYAQAGRSIYDFINDPAGETIWYRVSRELPKTSALHLSLSKKPTLDEVYEVVLTLTNHFKKLIEDGQLCNLLYDTGGKPKHESAAQLLFYGAASAYCEANDLDLSPESDGGRGPVDFKVSSGFKAKVLVEIKLTSNSQLIHGFEKQLPIYQAAEQAQRGIYLVIQNGGMSVKRWASFNAAVKRAGKKAPLVIYVDGVPRPSASKAEF